MNFQAVVKGFNTTLFLLSVLDSPEGITAFLIGWGSFAHLFAV